MVNWLGGCEADHSSPSNTAVKNAWTYSSTPISIFMTSHNHSQGVLYETSKPANLID